MPNTTNGNITGQSWSAIFDAVLAAANSGAIGIAHGTLTGTATINVKCTDGTPPLNASGAAITGTWALTGETNPGSTNYCQMVGPVCLTFSIGWTMVSNDVINAGGFWPQISATGVSGTYTGSLGQENDTICLNTSGGIGCTGNSGPTAPTISSLNPSSVPANSSSTTLTINGSNFVSGATVQWGQNGQTTTLTPITTNSSTVTVQIPAGLLTTPGTVQITVVNPGGSSSMASVFTITAGTAPGASITSLSPSPVVAGGNGFTLTATGTGFSPSSTIEWNGTPLLTTFLSATEITAFVNESLTAKPGTASITVVTGAQTSAPASFTIAAAGSGPIIVVKLVSNSNGVANGSCVTPPSVTSFTTTSPQVWVYFYVTGAAPTDAYTDAFVRPDGVQYHLGSTNAGSDTNFCWADAININGASAAAYLGTWSVNVYRNQLNTPLATVNFTLNAGNPTPDGFAVYRPSNGTWFILNRNSTSQYPVPSIQQQWGIPGDIPVPGDYDGDGYTDFAVWRPSNGTWYVLYRSAISTYPAPSVVQQWGLPGDIPVPGDYDGDGKTDFAVWRPSNGTWYIIPSSNPATPIIQQWGLNSDTPIVGDFNNDGKADFAVYRPSIGTWFVLYSNATNQWPAPSIQQQWGLPGDIPLSGDFNSDGKADFVVWRPSNGTWYVLYSSATNQYPNPSLQQQWGLPNDTPIMGDFNADGKNDFNIWRGSNGTWFSLYSTATTQWPAPSVVQQWGLPSDIPLIFR